jgi:hypothetical protein
VEPQHGTFGLCFNNIIDFLITVVMYEFTELLLLPDDFFLTKKEEFKVDWLLCPIYSVQCKERELK